MLYTRSLEPLPCKVEELVFRHPGHGAQHVGTLTMTHALRNSSVSPGFNLLSGKLSTADVKWSIMKKKD